jgi:hypothetical protein
MSRLYHDEGFMTLLELRRMFKVAAIWRDGKIVEAGTQKWLRRRYGDAAADESFPA